uniref:Polycystic kidney disease 2-like 1 protein n=1 Tax=Lygus hesperus TaxID=30085 RepID=A0A0A9XT39_LYGHE
MSSGDKPGGSERATHKTLTLKEPKLLTVGEIDARYLKILRMREEDDMADDYGFRRRFTGEEYGLAPIEQLVLSDDSASETTGETDALEDMEPEDGFETGRGGGGYLRQGAKLGAISRKILLPENPNRDQPQRMKKGKKKEGDETEKKKDGPKETRKEKSDSRSRSNTPDDQEAYVENAMRDFILYVIFLVIANMITFGVLDHAYNYYANTLSEIITQTPFATNLGVSKNFNEIRNVPQIWDFIRLILLKTMYEYGTDHAKTIRAGKREDTLVLFENILIGLPRIRQQRVKNDSCNVQAMFKDLFPSCYDYYTDSQEATEPFGMKNPTAWTYAPPNADSSRYTGKISSYGGGGYMMNLTTNKVYTTSWINELINNAWIQQGTRVVFIDFTTYTPNTNLFCVVKLVFELPPQEG